MENVLLAWVHGSAVQHMESLTDDQIMGTCTEILRKFLNTKDIPHPTKIRRSCWSTDSLCLGAYSCNSVTSQKNDVSDIADVHTRTILHELPPLQSIELVFRQLLLVRQCHLHHFSVK
jgi:hypothetical protein